MKLTDEDRKALRSISSVVCMENGTAERVALHFLRAGMERAALICDEMYLHGGGASKCSAAIRWKMEKGD